jgi:hypothetical protein
MTKRKFDETKELPSIVLSINNTVYKIADIIDWNPCELVSHLNPEDTTYFIKFVCSNEDFTIRCKDHIEQIDIVYSLMNSL